MSTITYFYQVLSCIHLDYHSMFPKIRTRSPNTGKAGAASSASPATAATSSLRQRRHPIPCPTGVSDPGQTPWRPLPAGLASAPAPAAPSKRSQRSTRRTQLLTRWNRFQHLRCPWSGSWCSSGSSAASAWRRPSSDSCSAFSRL